MSDKSKKRGATTNRRAFLSGSWTWLRWAAGVTLLYPLFDFIGYRAPRQPRLVKVNRAVPPGGFAIEHDFLLFNGPTGPWAVSRKCTHLGCRLNYQEKDGILVCPCHNSRFTKNGIRLSGPARKNLPLFKVAILPEATEGKGYQVTL